MDRVRTIFLGYRIYRIKFLKIVGFVLLITVMVFLGVLAFLVNIWTDDLRQQAQNVFMERERILGNIRMWALDYTDGMYESTTLMEDAAALFSSRDPEEYIRKRRENSLGNRTQISYLPVNIKKLLLDNQKQIACVTVSSETGGRKIIWKEFEDVRLAFESTEKEESAAFRKGGDMLAASCSVRNVEHMDQTLGTLEFWVNSREIYGRSMDSADWALWDEEDNLLLEHGLAGRGEDFPVQLKAQEELSGWLYPENRMPVYFVKQISEENGYGFLVVKDIGALLSDNRYTVLVMIAAFSLVALGVLACYYGGLCSDAAFLSMIMEMLSAMEGGNFGRIPELALPSKHKGNEYGMIAAALQDMGMKLKGYIETEYILKLKEQESQMRALQHQINPHFLYNTLEMLRSKALVHEDRDMADAIAMLGSLYRARMRKADSITLKEEFGFLEMYLKIMALRFGNNFVYQIELEKEIEEIPTVNFWLQPLAENFFAHGFDQESEYNLLIVNGYAKKGGAEILIIDNGSSADPSKLPDIRRNMIGGNDEAEADIGLRNVYMRMNYFYGNGFKMDVGNNAEGGFRVTIFIPGKEGKCTH